MLFNNELGGVRPDRFNGGYGGGNVEGGSCAVGEREP